MKQSLDGIRRARLLRESSTSRACRIPSASLAMARQGRGFTMIELMVTIAIAGILLIIAVPSLQKLILSNKLTTTANDIIVSINTARMEAIRRNANTQLCSDSASVNTSDTLGSACTTQTGAVYALAGGTPAAVQVRTSTVGLVAPLALHGDSVALRFSSQGLAYVPGSTTPYVGTVADICTASLSTNNHLVITMAAGSILVTQPPTTAACP